MSSELSPNAKHIQETLQSLGLCLQVLELPVSTRTAIEAAQAVGCQVGQIVKSLIFRLIQSDQPLLILVSGANRVNEKKISQRLGEDIARADPDFVRNHTGYAIGAVPPVGHLHPLQTLIDQDLLGYAQIWAAAGAPNAVFSLTPAELLQITGGQVVKIH